MNDPIKKAFHINNENTALKILRDQKRMHERLGLPNTEFLTAYKNVFDRMIGFQNARRILDMVNYQSSWQKQLGGLASIVDFSRAFSTQHREMAQMAHKIGLDYSETVNKWQEVSELLSSRLIGGNHSLRKVIGGVSYQLSKIAIQNQAWEMMQGLDDVLDEIKLVGESIVDKGPDTSYDFEELENRIEELELKGKGDKRKVWEQILLWLSVLVNLIAINDKAHEFLSKDQEVTLEHLEDFKLKLFEKLEEIKLKQDSLVVEREAKVHLNPKKRTLITDSLKSGTPIIKLSSSHKWILITYKGKQDSLPLNGWILKKYTRRD